jgi:hypothetical protein
VLLASSHLPVGGWEIFLLLFACLLVWLAVSTQRRASRQRRRPIAEQEEQLISTFHHLNSGGRRQPEVRFELNDFSLSPDRIREIAEENDYEYDTTVHPRGGPVMKFRFKGAK